MWDLPLPLSCWLLSKFIFWLEWCLTLQGFEWESLETGQYLLGTKSGVTWDMSNDQSHISPFAVLNEIL